jgi:RNA polymerase sigma-70 factor (ECF subfamily)
VTYLRSRPALLARFRQGERAALEEVYWAYVDRIERVARHGYTLLQKGQRVGGVAAEQVADLVQEVFTRAFAEKARASYDGQRDYGPYLVTIARNLLADWARKAGRELLIDAWSEEAEPPAPPSDAEPCADPATVALVENYLASLDEELRAVHRTRYDLGLSQDKAAEALGCTRQQLRTRENRLREGLRRALDREKTSR